MLIAEIEPNNHDRYAVAVKKNGEIIGHLSRQNSGGLSTTIFFFLRADDTARCRVIVTGHPTNLGDKLGQKVPCVLRLTGNKEYLKVLMDNIESL